MNVPENQSAHQSRLYRTTTHSNHESSSYYRPSRSSPAVASSFRPIKLPSLACEHESEGNKHEDAEDDILHDKANPQDIVSCLDGLVLLVSGLTLAAQLANQEEDANALNRERQHVQGGENDRNKSCWNPDLSEASSILRGNPIDHATETHIAPRSKKRWSDPSKYCQFKLYHQNKEITYVVRRNVRKTAALLFGFRIAITRVQYPNTSMEMPSIIR